jgi:hypothetical protein
VAYPQSAASLTFGGKYGFSITQQNGSENVTLRTLTKKKLSEVGEETCGGVEESHA